MNRNKLQMTSNELKKQLMLIDKYDSFMKMNFEYELGDIFEERDLKNLVAAVNKALLLTLAMKREVM